MPQLSHDHGAMNTKLLRTVGFTAGAAFAYARLIRPRLMNWGCTSDEIERAMPMDDDIVEPTVVTNRGITIDAPPDAVWPWIAQMGESPRGGFYSFTLVEKLLRMDVSNADEILPEYQEPKVGEALDRGGNMTVKAIVPGQCLVLGPPKGLDMDTTWALALYPTPDGGTRFISRCRVKYHRWTPAMLVAFLMLEPGQLIMELKMLHEVKKRAGKPAPVPR